MIAGLVYETITFQNESLHVAHMNFQHLCFLAKELRNKNSNHPLLQRSSNSHSMYLSLFSYNIYFLHVGGRTTILECTKLSMYSSILTLYTNIRDLVSSTMFPHQL